MKKFGSFIRNFYRITFVKPTGKKYTQLLRNYDYCYDENEIRTILKNDPEEFEPDGEIYTLLSNKVASRKRRVSENSFAGLFTFLFSIKNIEIKMAVISLVLIVSLGINPSSSYQVNRKISPFSLADTLKDSTRLDPQFYDQSIEQR